MCPVHFYHLARSYLSFKTTQALTPFECLTFPSQNWNKVPFSTHEPTRGCSTTTSRQEVLTLSLLLKEKREFLFNYSEFQNIHWSIRDHHALKPHKDIRESTPSASLENSSFCTLMW